MVVMIIRPDELTKLVWKLVENQNLSNSPTSLYPCLCRKYAWCQGPTDILECCTEASCAQWIVGVIFVETVYQSFLGTCFLLSKGYYLLAHASNWAQGQDQHHMWQSLWIQLHDAHKPTLQFLLYPTTCCLQTVLWVINNQGLFGINSFEPYIDECWHPKYSWKLL